MKWSHNKLVIASVKASSHKSTYSGLLWWQRHKGLNPVWVFDNFTEIYGEPPPEWVVDPIEPDSDLREYLGIMQNRWKQKKKREELKNGRTILPLETPGQR